MPRNPIIYEGNRGRRLVGIAQMNTDPQSSIELVPWVPAVDYIGIYKAFSENGTYTVEDEPIDSAGNGVWAFCKVNVNVYGGAAGGEDSIDDEEQIPDEYDETYDPSDEPETTVVGQEVEPAGTVDPNTGDVKEGSLVGKDRDSGSVMTISSKTGTDEDGNRVSVLKVSYDSIVAMKVVIPPRKRVYTDGEEIDLTGIKCMLFSKYSESTTVSSDDVIVYKDSRYGDGVVPRSELSAEPETALTANNTSGYRNGIYWIATPVRYRLVNIFIRGYNPIQSYGEPYDFVGQSAYFRSDRPISSNSSGYYNNDYIAFGDETRNYSTTWSGGYYLDPDPINYDDVNKGYMAYVVRQKYNGWDGWHYSTYVGLLNIDFPHTPLGGFGCRIVSDGAPYCSGPAIHGFATLTYEVGKFIDVNFVLPMREGRSLISEDELPWTDSSIQVYRMNPADLLNGSGRQYVTVSWTNPYNGEVLTDKFEIEVSGSD